MKKKITLSLDDDVYDALQVFPRKVSLSEVVTWMLRAMFQDIKAGRELSTKELQKWMDSTPEGRDFRERLKEHWGPAFDKIDAKVNKLKKSVKFEKNKQKGGLLKRKILNDIRHKAVERKIDSRQRINNKRVLQDLQYLQDKLKAEFLKDKFLRFSAFFIQWLEDKSMNEDSEYQSIIQKKCPFCYRHKENICIMTLYQRAVMCMGPFKDHEEHLERVKAYFQKEENPEIVELLKRRASFDEYLRKKKLFDSKAEDSCLYEETE